MFIINRKTEAESLICLPLLAALFGLIGIMANSPLAQAATKSTPNILFIIMDDVGIDLMKSFGYGGQTPILST